MLPTGPAGASGTHRELGPRDPQGGRNLEFSGQARHASRVRVHTAGVVDQSDERRNAARRRLMRRGIIVLYEDNHLLCIAKPAGLLSQGGPQGTRSLPDYLDAYRREADDKPGKAYIGLVHRLDRNTSGAMVVAKTSKAAGRLSECFRRRDERLKKTYLAWVQRRPEAEQADLVLRLRREKNITKLAADGDTDAKEARLHYEVVALGRDSARLRIKLETGISHQIRAQLSHVGHPLIGDEKYGGPSAKRPALHALQLEIPHPVKDTVVTIGAPVPEDLKIIDARLHMKPPV